MSNFFIDRPIFAWVVAILITLGGLLAVEDLGVQSYPNIAPPQVSVVTRYPGASSSTAEGAVTEVIEQQLTGIDNLLYFNSTTSSSGRVAITLTFRPGTDPDIAAVQTQNQVARAEPRLPPAVLAQGIVVANVACAEGGASLQKMPGGLEWKKRYDERFPGEFQVYSPYKYDATMLLADAMKRADSVDPKVYVPKIIESEYKGVTSTIQFEPNHEVKNPAITISTYPEGKKTPLE